MTERAPFARAEYRGRLAPTPSGPLHLGHARTFWIAMQRARQHGGTLVLRNEDLDPERCTPEFARQMLDDLRWLGLDWQEGPDIGGSFGPYVQSQRRAQYLEIWRQLAGTGLIYASPQSRQDIARALTAPHDDPPDEALPDEAREPIFPPALRPDPLPNLDSSAGPGAVNYRFRVPDGQAITFLDGQHGPVTRTAGVDFGDFLIWRKDGYPSYELAVVADDHAMQISEVVRGDDLLTSTARQWLLYQALGWTPPAFFHCPLVRDAHGKRLAKRTQAASLAEYRARGLTPEDVRELWRG